MCWVLDYRVSQNKLEQCWVDIHGWNCAYSMDPPPGSTEWHPCGNSFLNGQLPNIFWAIGPENFRDLLGGLVLKVFNRCNTFTELFLASTGSVDRGQEKGFIMEFHKILTECGIQHESPLVEKFSYSELFRLGQDEVRARISMDAMDLSPDGYHKKQSGGLEKLFQARWNNLKRRADR